MFKFSLCFLSGLLATTSALALESLDKCTVQNSCASMGYSKNIDPNCQRTVSCPFDLNYKICLDCSTTETDACPNGKYTLETCQAKGGVALNGTAENGCWTCQFCPNGYEMYLANKGSNCQSKTFKSYNGQTYQCCQSGCDYSDGTVISSANQISGPGTYYLSNNITVNKTLSGGTYTFKPTCENENSTLTFAAPSQAASGTIDSYVKTVYNSNGYFKDLRLHKGGTFERACSYDGSTGKNTPCNITLYGYYNYNFNDTTSGNVTNTNLWPRVSCKDESGQLNNTKPTIIFETSVMMSGSYFDGCINAVCYEKDVDGTITAATTCTH